ncbi:hypothetical protein CJA_2450 [Cellvibrio japonicus Ueda107]|uniref:Uncharacterized protein n=1 Tax=Cellvibrio japonicus (strain Ueda107) TaxID=498211 RepID=B3PKI2_CELJU|nr:hypothetical protein CJA_2450 [Cellvibrio japonicus Ueda107]
MKHAIIGKATEAGEVALFASAWIETQKGLELGQT